MIGLKETTFTKDVEIAKKAVWLDDEADDNLAELFPADNDPTKFRGTRKELSEIRSAMKRYENQEAEMVEDKAFYDARFRLQFVEYENDD